MVTVSHQSSAWAFRAALPVQRAGPQVVPDVPDLILHVSLCLGEDDVGVDIPIAVGSTCAGIVAGGLLTAYPSRAMASIWLNHASVAAAPVLSIPPPSSTGSLTPSPWERIASAPSGRYQGRRLLRNAPGSLGIAPESISPRCPGVPRVGQRPVGPWHGTLERCCRFSVVGVRGADAPAGARFSPWSRCGTSRYRTPRTRP